MKKKWLVPYTVIASVTSIIHPLHIKSKTKKTKPDKWNHIYNQFISNENNWKNILQTVEKNWKSSILLQIMVERGDKAD